MSMAALSLILTASYVGLAASNQELACNVAPVYLALVVFAWWAGRRLERSRRA